MLDALSTVIVQLAVIVAVAALAGGVLGWLLGSRRARRRALATAAAPSGPAPMVEPLPAPVPDASPLSPPPTEPAPQPQAPFSPRPRPREVPMPATASGVGLAQSDDEFAGASEPRIGTVVVTREQRAQGREEEAGESPDPQASISTVIQPHKAPVLHPSDARVEVPEPPESHAEPVSTPSPDGIDEMPARIGWESASAEQAGPADELPPAGEPDEQDEAWLEEPTGWEQGHEASTEGYADASLPAPWDEPAEAAEDETAAVGLSEVPAEWEPVEDGAAVGLSEAPAELASGQDEAVAVGLPETSAELELGEDEETEGTALDAEDSAIAEPADDETHAAEVARFKARIAELEELVNRRERDLMRLETGATAAWDTTVPSLERAIEELRQENGELQAALNAVRAQVESAQLELELVQKSRGSMPRATDTY